MPYLWIFLACYAVAFVIIHMKLATQMESMETRLSENGSSLKKFRANIRANMPWPKELLIRVWAPFVLSVLPTGIVSLGYFIFS